MNEPSTLLARALAHLRAEGAKDHAYLLPLRLFVGVGWLRAAGEKALEPGWWDGTALAAWLAGHVSVTPFPAYGWLLEGVFLPNALPLAWLVVLGQLAAGLGILVGAFTRAALLGGLFMNLNFVLAGEPSPSAFYIVIQLALLAGNAGLVLGVDGWRARTPARRPSLSTRLVGAAGLLGLAAAALPFARDFSPGGSVEDPAIILTVASTFAAGYLLLSALRTAGKPAVLETAPPQNGRRGFVLTAASRARGADGPGLPRPSTFAPLSPEARPPGSAATGTGAP